MTPPLRGYAADSRLADGSRLPVAAEIPPAVAVPLVRRATRADHVVVCDLLRDLELDWPARDLASFFVADVRGEVAGIAELRRIGGFHLLSCVGVREDLQGAGLGRALVEGVVAAAAGDVWLYTQIPGFFERLGFADAASAPAGLPARRIYGCDGCDVSRCRCMVRRRSAAALPDAGPLRAAHLGALAAVEQGPDEVICDLAPASLWIWRDCESPSLAQFGGNTCIRLDAHHESPYFLEPLGTGDLAESLDACVRAAGRVSRVRSRAVAALPEGPFDVVPLRDHFDYVCDVRRVAALRGTKHDGKRNGIRRFVREHPHHEVRALTAEDRGGALALFDRWALAAARSGVTAEAPALPTLGCQRRALERAFDDFHLLGLSGCAIADDGVLLGFVLGSRCGETVVAHFQYADATLPGIYPMLLAEACRGVFADAVRINLEEDLGIAGLRRTKLSWDPVRLIEKYQVKRRAACEPADRHAEGS